jgi:hypothetical protein
MIMGITRNSKAASPQGIKHSANHVRYYVWRIFTRDRTSLSTAERAATRSLCNEDVRSMASSPVMKTPWVMGIVIVHSVSEFVDSMSVIKTP